MSRQGIGSHTKPNAGVKDEWLTPPVLIKALGPFDTDPCAAVGQPWETARVQYTVEDDGLSKTWTGMVWCNPPYGPQTWKWLAALASHGSGIALVFARTETAGFFQEVWAKASALLFIEGRLHFHHIDGTRAAGNSGGPSVLVAYGSEAARRLYACRSIGRFIRLQEAAA